MIVQPVRNTSIRLSLKILSSPLMGGGILLAIIVFTARMRMKGSQVSAL